MNMLCVIDTSANIVKNAKNTKITINNEGREQGRTKKNTNKKYIKKVFISNKYNNYG